MAALNETLSISLIARMEDNNDPDWKRVAHSWGSLCNNKNGTVTAIYEHVPSGAFYRMKVEMSLIEVEQTWTEVH